MPYFSIRNKIRAVKVPDTASFHVKYDESEMTKTKKRVQPHQLSYMHVPPRLIHFSKPTISLHISAPKERHRQEKSKRDGLILESKQENTTRSNQKSAKFENCDK
jgi:hypothetical protein